MHSTDDRNNVLNSMKKYVFFAPVYELCACVTMIMFLLPSVRSKWDEKSRRTKILPRNCLREHIA